MAKFDMTTKAGRAAADAYAEQMRQQRLQNTMSPPSGGVRGGVKGDVVRPGMPGGQTMPIRGYGPNDGGPLPRPGIGGPKTPVGGVKGIVKDSGYSGYGYGPAPRPKMSAADALALREKTAGPMPAPGMKHGGKVKSKGMRGGGLARKGVGMALRGGGLARKGVGMALAKGGLAKRAGGIAKRGVGRGKMC